MSEAFVVRNDSGGDLELKDFGVVIPDGETAELGHNDRVFLSSELDGLLQSEDLVRVVGGEDVPYSQSKKCCFGSLPQFTGLKHYNKQSELQSTTTSSTWETKVDLLEADIGEAPDGTYALLFYSELFRVSAQGDCEGQVIVIVGGSVYTWLGKMLQPDAGGGGGLDMFPFSGFFFPIVNPSNMEFFIQFKTRGAGKEVGIKRARLLLVKVG